MKEGSVLGGILLLAGSCIGAGMLALPVITGIAGFVPSLFLFVVAWLFMTSTGLLLLEANLTLGHELSLISIAEKTLGKGGKVLCWFLFLLLFYCLSVAYVAASGSILQGLAADLFNVSIPAWGGSVLFTTIFALVLYVGTREVDLVNRWMMIALVFCYLTLIALGSRHIQASNLTVYHWKYAYMALPVVIISFGFHNMIPSLAMYLKGDRRRLFITVVIGSSIPLLVYLVWEVVMLGIIPIGGRAGLLEALDQGQAATSALRGVVGKSWVNTVAGAFALFAIITSFLAQQLSIVDFLADGFKMAKVGVKRFFLIGLSITPPFVFALLYPGVFIQALNWAGGFSAVILFGIMPALMVWVLRYKRRLSKVPLLPLGRPLLILVLCIASLIFLIELAQELGFSVIPPQVEAVP